MNLKKEVAALERLTVNDLREKYADVYGEPTYGRHKHWLVRRRQALEAGYLSERARDDADARSQRSRRAGDRSADETRAVATERTRLKRCPK